MPNDFKVGKFEMFIVTTGLSNYPLKSGKVSIDMIKVIYTAERSYNKKVLRPKSRLACYEITSDKVRRILRETNWYPNEQQLTKAFKKSPFYWLYWYPSKIFNKIYLLFK